MEVLPVFVLNERIKKWLRSLLALWVISAQYATEFNHGVEIRLEGGELLT